MNGKGTGSRVSFRARLEGLRPGFDELFRRWEPVAFWVLFGAMCFVFLLPPTLTVYLPFSDLPGHLGIVGAVLHRDDPAYAIRSHFWINPNFGPNCLEFCVTYALAKVVDITLGH